MIVKFLAILYFVIVILYNQCQVYVFYYSISQDRQSFISTEKLQEQVPLNSIKSPTCIYPFDDFLTQYDREKYKECVEKTKLLNEPDANTYEDAKQFYIKNYAKDEKVPQHFEPWYYFAKRRDCRINRYDGLHSQLLPFRTGEFSYNQLRDLVNLFNNSQLTSFYSKQGRTYIVVNSERAAAYKPVFSRLQAYLPDFQFIINTHAQPVVLYNKNYEKFKKSKTKLNQYRVGLGKAELTIRGVKRNITKIKNFSDIIENSCEPDEYRSSLMEGYGLFINPPEEYQTTKLMPILSWGNYPGCTKDILVPSVYHYGTVNGAVLKTTIFRNWNSKYKRLVWRDATSGSPFYMQEYSEYLPSHVCIDSCTIDQTQILEPQRYSQKVWFWSHRQRAAAYALEYPSLLDIGLTNGVEMAEQFRKEIYYFHKRTYRFTFKRFFDYRYILDIDGNGYSGRFQSLLQGNSLIFAAHYATDWFSDISIPFFHYIPVHMGYSTIDTKILAADFKEKLMSLKTRFPKFTFKKTDKYDGINTPLGFNDLAPKVLYYQENDKLSEQIAIQGQEFAKKYLRDDDMDCYLYRVIIELYEILKIDEK